MDCHFGYKNFKMNIRKSLFLVSPPPPCMRCVKGNCPANHGTTGNDPSAVLFSQLAKHLPGAFPEQLDVKEAEDWSHVWVEEKTGSALS